MHEIYTTYLFQFVDLNPLINHYKAPVPIVLMPFAFLPQHFNWHPHMTQLNLTKSFKSKR